MDTFRENVELGSEDTEVVKLWENDIATLPPPLPSPHSADSADSAPRHSESLIRLSELDSLTLASRISHHGFKPCVLNFANNDIPGGPTRLKGHTQEEVLFKTSTLGASIGRSLLTTAADQSSETGAATSLYPLDIVENLRTRWDYKRLGLLYSPQVHVRNDDRRVSLGTEFSAITCAAILFPRVASDGLYLHPEDRDVTSRKIAMICDTAIKFDHPILVAGMWGCGAFCNPIREVADLWVEVASTRPLEIVFPCLGESGDDFARALRKSISKFYQNPARP